MVLSYQPLKVLMPPAVFLFLVGSGKLLYDVVASDFKIAINTIVLLGAAFSIGLLAMLADLLVHLNKKRHDLIPATLPRAGS